MKHSLELFEQPIPTLRAPEPKDADRIAEIARAQNADRARKAPGDVIGQPGFCDTSVVAELDGEIVGWVSAYLLPYDAETLFIWQVWVDDDHQGTGLTSLMLGHLMRQEACAGLTRVQTAISSSEERSWALFRRFARWQRSRLDIQPYVTQAFDMRRRHESDNLVTIRLDGTKTRAA